MQPRRTTSWRDSPADEWESLANIYYHREWERTNRRPWLDAGFYHHMSKWFSEQGCEISVYGGREVRWRDDAARIEFWLRWADEIQD